MSISTQFGQAQQWTQTHFGGVALGDVRRSRRVVTLAVYLALAGLGGHLGRNGDGPPIRQTLWLGRRSLRLLVEGVQLAAQLLDD